MFHQPNDPSRELVLTSSSYLPDPTLTPQSQAAFNASNNKLTGGQWSYLDGVIETGNLTRDNAGRTFTYDLENRQKTFNGTTYVYDGEGRRAEKVAGGRTTIFVYNASGQLVADYSGLPPSETSGTSYVTADHLGSTRVVSGTGGTAKKCYDYLPFGEQIPSSIGGRSSLPCSAKADSLRQKFTGKERDLESGLDYFEARYCSGAHGRFTTADPLEAVTLEKERLAEQISDPRTWNK